MAFRPHSRVTPHAVALPPGPQDELERVQLRDTVKALREEMKAEQEYFSTTLEQQKAVSERTISKLQVGLGCCAVVMTESTQNPQPCTSLCMESPTMEWGNPGIRGTVPELNLDVHSPPCSRSLSALARTWRT